MSVSMLVSEPVAMTNLTKSQPVCRGVDLQLQQELIGGRPRVVLGGEVGRQESEPPPELGERQVLRVALLVETEGVQQLGTAQLGRGTEDGQ